MGVSTGTMNFVERERTPRQLMGLSIRLHLAGLDDYDRVDRTVSAGIY